MKKHMSRVMRLLSWCGGLLVTVAVMLCVAAVLGLLLTDTAQAAQMPMVMLRMLPQGLKIFGFTLSTAIAAVLLSFPFSWSLSLVISFFAPHKWRSRLERTVNGLSAVPAVVFGYMSLSYIVPGADSAWWAVVSTLILMSLMRQTRALVRVNDRYRTSVEAGKAMGAYIYETVFQLVLPQVRRRYVAVALRMLARALTEGVAILLVLSAYSNGADTLATALMRALGVTGDNAQAGWVLLLATLMLMLVLLSNALISATVQGGRHGTNDKK